MTNCINFKNLGAATCPNLAKIARRLEFIPEFDSSQTKNEFANEAAVTKAALQAKFDAANIKDRFFVTPLLENVEDIRSETTFQEFNSGNKKRVKKGVRHFIGYFTDEHPLLLEKLESWRGQDFGINIIDSAKNYIYSTDKETKTKVQPILVDGESFDVQLMKSTDAEVNMIKIEFDYRTEAEDSLLRYIDANSLDFNGLSSSDLYSLWDVESTFTSPVAAGVTVQLDTDYGIAVEGLLVGDLAIYNITTSAAVVPTSITESTTVPGSYDIVYPAQTPANVLRFTFTKSKYDFALVTADTQTLA